MELASVPTPRLNLRPLPRSAYSLLADGKVKEAEDLLEIALDGSRVIEFAPVLHWRLAQLERNPDELPWLIHLMVLREGSIVIGDVGFHGMPDADGFVEIGYTVCEKYRRQGFATEAAIGMARWAGGQPGVRGLRASISPTNVASLQLAKRLGLIEVGTQIDEIDGLELVFEGPIP